VFPIRLFPIAPKFCAIRADRRRLALTTEPRAPAFRGARLVRFVPSARPHCRSSCRTRRSQVRWPRRRSPPSPADWRSPARSRSRLAQGLSAGVQDRSEDCLHAGARRRGQGRASGERSKRSLTRPSTSTRSRVGAVQARRERRSWARSGSSRSHWCYGDGMCAEHRPNADGETRGADCGITLMLLKRRRRVTERRLTRGRGQSAQVTSHGHARQTDTVRLTGGSTLRYTPGGHRQRQCSGVDAAIGPDGPIFVELTYKGGCPDAGRASVVRCGFRWIDTCKRLLACLDRGAPHKVSAGAGLQEPYEHFSSEFTG
jgi:hypothetical protein